MRSILLLFCLIPLFVFCQDEKKISLEDIWINYTFYPSSLRNVHFIDDSNFVFSEHLRLYKYSVKSMSVSDSIAYPTVTDSLQFSNYIPNNSFSTILLETESKQIYRRSSTAKYKKFDIATNTLHPVANDDFIRIPSYSPNDSLLLFFKENNIYLQDNNDKITPVTKDGEVHKIINGAPDWVYEEEFELRKAYWWSPDSKHIAYLKYNETAVKTYGIDVYDSIYPGRHTFKYPKVGETNSTVSIHLYNIENKTTQLITCPDSFEYTTDITWLNSNNFLIQKYNRFQDSLLVYTYNIHDTNISLTYSESSETYLEFPNFLHAIDSSSFLFLSDKDGYKHIYIKNTVSGDLTRLTKGNYEVSEILSTDDTFVYYTSTEQSPLERHIYKLSFSGENKLLLNNAPGTHYGKFSPNNTCFLNYFSNAQNNFKVLLQNNKGAVLKEIVKNEHLSANAEQYKLQPKEFFTILTADSIELNAYIIKPQKLKKHKKYPVLFSVYGGPLRQTVTNDFDYNYYWHNLLVDEGYIVVSVDVRGTGARGREFNKCTNGKLGQLETQDIISSINYLCSLPFVDENRIGIQGWSYGGYMTLMTMCLGNKIKAGISVAPISDWRFYDSIYTERYMKTTKENNENYIASSPLQYAEKLHGSLLLIHGSFDDNVHPQNSYQFAEKLVDHGIDFQFFVYPNKNHNIMGGLTRYHLYKKMTDFILSEL